MRQDFNTDWLPVINPRIATWFILLLYSQQIHSQRYYSFPVIYNIECWTLAEGMGIICIDNAIPYMVSLGKIPNPTIHCTRSFKFCFLKYKFIYRHASLLILCTSSKNNLISRVLVHNFALLICGINLLQLGIVILTLRPITVYMLQKFGNNLHRKYFFLMKIGHYCFQIIHSQKGRSILDTVLSDHFHFRLSALFGPLKSFVGLRGTAPPTKSCMLCALSQNNQQLFDK